MDDLAAEGKVISEALASSLHQQLSSLTVWDVIGTRILATMASGELYFEFKALLKALSRTADYCRGIGDEVVQHGT